MKMYIDSIPLLLLLLLLFSIINHKYRLVITSLTKAIIGWAASLCSSIAPLLPMHTGWLPSSATANGTQSPRIEGGGGKILYNLISQTEKLQLVTNISPFVKLQMDHREHEHPEMLVNHRPKLLLKAK